MRASAFDASDPRVRDFLDASTVVELATVSPSGRPFVTPLWFVCDDGALYVTTAATSRAARNVAPHPAVAILLHRDRSWRLDPVLLMGAGTGSSRCAGRRPCTTRSRAGACSRSSRSSTT